MIAMGLFLQKTARMFRAVAFVKRIPPALPVRAKKFYFCVEKENLQC